MEALTDADLAELRGMLLDRREALEAAIERGDDRPREETELRAVAIALADMDTGDYGFCRVCERPMGMARLRARPTARLCLECRAQTKRS